MSGSNKRPADARQIGKPAVALFAILISGTVLGGCMQAGPRYDAPFMLANPNERHPILVSNSEARLDIPVYGSSYGLTRHQESQLYSYLHEFRRSKGTKIVIRAPSGGASEKAARRVYADVRDILRSQGFTRDMVELVPYNVSYKQSPALRLSYERYVAKGPVCGDWSENLARDPQNMPYPNLGCATQANLAAQVANPRDLVEPRGETPRSSERRDVVWGKYVKGQVTGAERSDDERVQASDVESN
ncbi:CpaD family pilus assembly protein [Methyloligella sp. 2.7D]|uniref:CpaD family pilus assembly protein n=1 Tax=unclassified Methyloligella TaxID=2625955 RepID=UPI00157C2DEE|nr:CpaD family pilus assembly protein [Methyloligella sp. GL2]QKP78586.1 CpaD family pilus assembly protein [Methyloligella sp. GL2]